MPDTNERSWYTRIFGRRSIFSIIFGKFFEVKNNTAGLIASTLVITLCFVIIYKVNEITNFTAFQNGLLNVIFVVIGYYFGAKQHPITQDDNE